jgi:hypothetical protein
MPMTPQSTAEPGAGISPSHAGMRAGSVLATGALALAVGLLGALMLSLIRSLSSAASDEAAAARVVGGLGLLGLLGIGGYLAARWRDLRPATLALACLATVTLLLTATYFYAIGSAVRFPADILLWSEGDFVSDIVKFRIGYPLYSAPANLDSFTYTPGSQILTQAIATLIGAPDSIPVYRGIQLGYVALAALLGGLACRRVVMLTSGGAGVPHPVLWSVVWVPGLFLIGGNLVTSPFVHLLHNDALALLVSVLAYGLLVEWVATRRNWLLLPMALLPGLGFLVKQSLIVWAGAYTLYLVLWGRDLGWARIALFAAAAFGSVGIAVGACYLLWGDNFIYWTFRVMGNHGVSPLRSVQHALAAWAYFAAGLVGGIVLLPWKEVDRVTGLWLVALGLLAIEAYTSGIAWMLNHMGPGSLLCGIWFMATLVRGWQWLDRAEPGRRLPSWGRAFAVTAVLVLGLSGLGMIRVPTPVLPDDAARYARQIESAFAGQPVERVLLDYGSWMHARHGVVMKDHAAPIGEAGYTETADFSGVLRRIATHYYSRILVRDYDSPEFTYDYYLWPRSSGIRAALEANYRVTGRIEAVQGRGPNPPWFKTITILEPRAP